MIAKVKTEIERQIDDVLIISLEAVDRAFFDRCKPKPVRSMREFFEQEIIIPSGPRKGEAWSADTQPVQGLLLDLMDSGEFTEHITVGPSQTGKSVVGYIGPVIYHAAEMRETVVLGVPGGGMINDKWNDVKDILDASPSLKNLIPSTGPGSKGGQIRDLVTLSNGSRLRLMTTGVKNTGRAGYTSRVVACTEMAEFSAAGQKNAESDPYRQIQARQRSFDPDKRRTYAEGTVTTEAAYPWAARIGAAVANIVMPCPHCREFVTLDRENLKGWEDAADAEEALESTYLECPKCQSRIDDNQRREMVKQARVLFDGQTIDRDGNITGERARSKRLWFRYNAAHNLLVHIGEIGAEEWQAKQHPEDSKQRSEAERQLSQQVWAIAIKPAIDTSKPDEAKPETIAARRANLPRGIIPARSKFVACGIDVGAYRLHLTTLAVTEANQIQVIEHPIYETGYEGLDGPIEYQTAVRLALSELIDKLLKGYLQDQTGQYVKPSKILIDNSWETDTIRAVIAGYLDSHPDTVYAVRGKGSNAEKRYTVPQNYGRMTVDIAPDQSYYTVLVGESVLISEVNSNADIFKSRVQASALSPVNSPGALILHDAPQKEHLKFCRELFAERLITKYTETGKETQQMVNTAGRKANHHLDSTAYALTGLMIAGWDYQEVQGLAFEYAKAARALQETKEDGIMSDEEKEFIDHRMKEWDPDAEPEPVQDADDEPEENTSDTWDATQWGVQDDDPYHPGIW